ncbi:unnamed protein product, partial [Protopolystoma xenopodis]
MAERVSSERSEIIGQSVGYTVRFETILPRAFGSICFCTVGTMARKVESGMRGISHVIVDEIHERDVNSDFMLILLSELAHAHKDIRIILMSATIDVTMFCEYFGGCAVLDIEGRTYPVTAFYLEDCIKMLNYVPPPPDDRKRKRREELASIHNDPAENAHLICPTEYGPQ